MASGKNSSPFTWRALVVTLLILGAASIILLRGDVLSGNTLATLLACVGLVRLVTLKSLGSHGVWGIAGTVVGVAIFFSHVGERMDAVSDATFAFDTINSLNTIPGLRAAGEPVESSDYMNAALQTCSPDRLAHLGMLDLVHEASQIVYLSGAAGDVNQAVSDVRDVAATKKRAACAQILGDLAVRHPWVKATVQAERSRLEKLPDNTERR